MSRKRLTALPPKLEQILKNTGYTISAISQETGIPIATLYSNLAGTTEMSLKNALLVAYLLTTTDEGTFQLLLIIRELAKDKSGENNPPELIS